MSFLSNKREKLQREIIEQIILEKYNQYYRLAYGYVHNEADASDIVQNGAYKAIRSSHTLKKIEYAEAQINAYLMAMEKDDTSNENFKEKLQQYQDLRKKYLAQKQELKNEGLEQKSLTDTDSRRMKNNGSLGLDN